jgi:hypothetical protein
LGGLRGEKAEKQGKNEITLILAVPKGFRVNWIDATAISAYLTNAIATLNFGKTPLQFFVCLRNAITPTYPIYTGQYTPYYQPYMHTHGGIHQNQPKKLSRRQYKNMEITRMHLNKILTIHYAPGSQLTIKYVVVSIIFLTSPAMTERNVLNRLCIDENMLTGKHLLASSAEISVCHQ